MKSIGFAGTAFDSGLRFAVIMGAAGLLTTGVTALANPAALANNLPFQSTSTQSACDSNGVNARFSFDSANAAHSAPALSVVLTGVSQDCAGHVAQVTLIDNATKPSHSNTRFARIPQNATSRSPVKVSFANAGVDMAAINAINVTIS